MTDFADWTVANALVHAAVNQINQTSQPIVGAGEVVLPFLTVTQIGIDINIQFQFPNGAGTVPFGELRAEWFDSASNQLVWQDSFYMAGGNGAFIQYCLSMMAKGDQLTLVVDNKDPAQTLSYVIAATQHSRPMPKDRAYQPFIGGVFGFNQPGGNPLTGEHCNTSPSIAPNASVSRLMPFSTGKHRISTGNLSGANAMTVAITDAFSGDLITKWAVGAGAADVREVNLPSSACQLTLANTQATNTITPNFTSMREDF